MRVSKATGSCLKDALGTSLQEEEIKRLVNQDVTAKFRPSTEDDQRDSDSPESKYKKKLEFELKLKETFDQVKKSSKLNKLLYESFHVIQADYESVSAQKGAKG